MPPRGGAAPITTDPPKHAAAKSLLLPAFTPDAIERYAVKTREICRELVEKVAGKSACDAAGSIGGIHRTWLNSQRNLCGREAEFPRAILRRSSASVCWRPLGRTNYAFAPTLNKPGHQHKYCGSDGCPNGNFDDFARSKINAPQSQ